MHSGGYSPPTNNYQSTEMGPANSPHTAGTSHIPAIHAEDYSEFGITGHTDD